jgi:hypothetical protein
MSKAIGMMISLKVMYSSNIKNMKYIEICMCFLIVVVNSVCSQTTEKNSVKKGIMFKNEITINATFFGIHIKQCPGQISGDKNCIRTIYLLSENSKELPTLKSIKNGEYELKNSEKVVIYDVLGINLVIQNSDLPEDKKRLLFDSINSNLKGSPDLIKKEYIKEKKGKNKIIYSMPIKETTALLFEADKDFLNSTLRNRINIISSKPKIPIIVFL